MTNKKISIALAFIITTFAFFAFYVNTSAEDGPKPIDTKQSILCVLHSKCPLPGTKSGDDVYFYSESGRGGIELVDNKTYVTCNVNNSIATIYNATTHTEYNITCRGEDTPHQNQPADGYDFKPETQRVRYCTVGNYCSLTGTSSGDVVTVQISSNPGDGVYLHNNNTVYCNKNNATMQVYNETQKIAYTVICGGDNYNPSAAGMPTNFGYTPINPIRGLGDDGTDPSNPTGTGSNGKNSVKVVNSGQNVSDGAIKLDGGICTSFKVCRYRNLSTETPQENYLIKDYADGSYTTTGVGPYTNQVNLMYYADSLCSDYPATHLTAFCIEAGFYGPADGEKSGAKNGCMEYKATPIRTDSVYEVALYELYLKSGGDLLGAPEEYFKYQSAMRILQYFDDIGYQPRISSTNISGHSKPYANAAKGGDPKAIGKVGPDALQLAIEARDAAKAKIQNGGLLTGLYGIRASQITSFVEGSSGYEATFAVTVQNVNDPNEITFDDIKFEFGDSGLSKRQQGDATYDAATKNLTFTAVVSGMAGEPGSCENSTLKVTLTKESQADIRKAFMLDSVTENSKNGHQRFAVFAKGAPQTVSYETVLSNCQPEPVIPEACEMPANLTCNESDVNGVITVNEGSENGGDTKWEECIIHKTDSQGNSYDVVDNSEYKATVDTGLESDNIQGYLSTGDAIEDIAYCTISCKEQYKFLLPGNKEQVAQGTYFSFHTNGVQAQHMVVGINAERKCVSSNLEIDKFNTRVKDLRAQQVDYMNAYLYYYQLYKAMTSKEVIQAYTHRMRRATIQGSFTPNPDPGCGEDPCSCGPDYDIENPDCSKLAIAEEQAACEALGGIYYYTLDYKFTQPDTVTTDGGYAENNNPYKLSVKLYTLKDLHELNNVDPEVLDEHEISVDLTKSYDEIVKQIGGYEITKLTRATKEFYDSFYGGGSEEAEALYAQEFDGASNNYFVFENKVESVPAYMSPTNENKTFDYIYISGGKKTVKTTYANNSNQTVESCEGQDKTNESRKITHVNDDADHKSNNWAYDNWDYKNDKNNQFEVYLGAISKIKKSYEQAKKKYEALAAQIADQAGMLQTCTNYLKNMESNVRAYEFNPVITFSYPDQKTYMDMLSPNILTNVESTAPTVNYNTYFCKDTKSNPEDIFGCGQEAGEEYKFKFLNTIQIDENDEQKEDLDAVKEELEEFKEKQNTDNSGLAVVNYYNAGSVGSKAVYGRYSHNGSDDIEGKYYEKYDKFNKDSCDDCFEFYQSDKQFYTVAPDGVVTTNPGNKNSTIVDTDGRVYPVAMNTKPGYYEFNVKFSNIGQFNESGNLGRIMGGGDGKPGTMVGEAADKQVCYYKVCRIDDAECLGRCPTEPYKEKEVRDCVKEGKTLDKCIEEICDKEKEKDYSCPTEPYKTDEVTACVKGGKSLKECREDLCPGTDDKKYECPTEPRHQKEMTKCVNGGTSFEECEKTYCKGNDDLKCPKAPYHKKEMTTCVNGGTSYEDCYNEYCVKDDEYQCPDKPYHKKEMTSCVKGGTPYDTCYNKYCNNITEKEYSCPTEPYKTKEVTECVKGGKSLEKCREDLCPGTTEKKYKCPTEPYNEKEVTACVNGGRSLDDCVDDYCPGTTINNYKCPTEPYKEKEVTACVNGGKSLEKCKEELCPGTTEKKYKCPQSPYYEKEMTSCVNSGNSYSTCEAKYCNNNNNNDTCEDIEKNKCNNGVVQYKSVFSDEEFTECVTALIKHPSGCCSKAENYFEMRADGQYHMTEFQAYKIPSAVEDEWNEKCPHDKECESFVIITTDNTGGELLTDTNNVINSGELQFNARTVSNNNLFPNGNSSLNWNTAGAQRAIVKIEDSGDGIFNENPDYHITLTGTCVTEIKKYNEKQEGDGSGYDNGGYNDYTLDILNATTKESVQNVVDRVGSKAGWSTIDSEFKKILQDYCGLTGEKVDNGPDEIDDKESVVRS